MLSLCLDPVEKKTIWVSTTNSHINKWVGVYILPDMHMCAVFSILVLTCGDFRP